MILENYGKIFTVAPRSAVLSIFPHRRNPEISARLFEAFEHQSLEPDALANSPSTLSVVLNQDMIDSASHALFEPFTFSAYQTPEDWKLAQLGKEKLYKEVVASYQEKKPKVYGLEALRRAAPGPDQIEQHQDHSCGSLFSGIRPPQHASHLSCHRSLPSRREKNPGLLPSCLTKRSLRTGDQENRSSGGFSRNPFGEHFFDERPSFRRSVRHCERADGVPGA